MISTSYPNIRDAALSCAWLRIKTEPVTPEDFRMMYDASFLGLGYTVEYMNEAAQNPGLVLKLHRSGQRSLRLGHQLSHRRRRWESERRRAADIGGAASGQGGFVGHVTILASWR